MTEIRTELSKKNEFYIGKYRYLELKYFCLQYPSWKRIANSLDGLSKSPEYLALIKSTGHGDPTAKCVQAKMLFTTKMELVNRAVKETDDIMSNYILLGVTENLTYDKIKARLNIPCCRGEYYKLYRKFFYILHNSQNLQLLL